MCLEDQKGMVHLVDTNDTPLDLHILTWQEDKGVVRQDLIDYPVAEVLNAEKDRQALLWRLI